MLIPQGLPGPDDVLEHIKYRLTTIFLLLNPRQGRAMPTGSISVTALRFGNVLGSPPSHEQDGTPNRRTERC